MANKYRMSRLDERAAWLLLTYALVGVIIHFWLAVPFLMAYFILEPTFLITLWSVLALPAVIIHGVVEEVKKRRERKRSGGSSDSDRSPEE